MYIFHLSLSFSLSPYSQMVQCGRCDSWVHSHCDNLSGEIKATVRVQFM